MHRAPSAKTGEYSERRWPPAVASVERPRPVGEDGAGGGPGDGCDEQRGQDEDVGTEPPRSHQGPGNELPSGMKYCCGSLVPLDFCSICSLIILEAGNLAARERLFLAIRTTVSDIFHARQSTDVRPHGKALFTLWFTGFVVTYGKDRNSGSC